jgi:hypothetical protein
VLSGLNDEIEAFLNWTLLFGVEHSSSSAIDDSLMTQFGAASIGLNSPRGT